MRLRSGLALILVVGVLGILAVLGSAFSVLSRLERRASAQRVLGTQASLLSRSGIEDALARIAMGQDTDTYGGEDWAGDGWDAYDQGQEVYRLGVMNVADCPVQHALRPNYFVREIAGTPRRIPVEGRWRGYSGRLAAGTWALKVEDESAKINVNGGFLDTRDRDGDGVEDCRDPSVRLTTMASDTGLGWNGQLSRILGVLAGQLGLPPTLGTDILQARPPRGYRSLDEVQALLGATTDLSPYLTVASWVDRKVIHPHGYAAEGSLPSSEWFLECSAERKRLRAPLAIEDGGRPPVNLNSAPRAVLYALVSGLQGRSFQTPNASLSFVWSNPTAVSQVVTRMMSWRTPTAPKTWAEFNRVCDSSLCQGGGFHVVAVDTLKANFNPNTGSNKELPDQVRWTWVDKTDLSNWSTEGCLRPTGVFRVSCAGRICRTDGRLLAQASLSSTVRPYDLFRQTSQKDFSGGRTSLYDGSGDGFLSLAGPPAMPTYQSNGATAGASWWGGAPRPEGLGSMTYPCPPTAVVAGRATDLDGYLGLSTVQEMASNPMSGTQTFLVHFDDALEADSGASPLLLAPGVNPAQGDRRLQRDITQDVWPSSPGAEANTLCPDGLHAQPERCPGYPAAPNFPAFANGGNRAVVMYWVKRASSYVGTPGAYGVQMDVSTWREELPPPGAGAGMTQAFGIGRCRYTPQGGPNTRAQMGIVAERRRDMNESPAFGKSDIEQHFRLQELPAATGTALLPGLTWSLAVGWMDTNEMGAGRGVNLRWLRAGYPLPTNLWTETFSGFYVPYLTNAGIVGPNTDLMSPGAVLSIGPPGPLEENPAHLIENQRLTSVPNQVIDELSIYDFGDNMVTAYNNGFAWALQRFRDGRYYKGNDASFTSTDLSPDGGRPVRILSVHWTSYLPKEPRRDVLTVGAMSAGPGPSSTSPWAAPAWRGVSRPPDPYLGRASVGVEIRRGVAPLVDSVPLVEGRTVSMGASSFRYRVTFRPNLSRPQDQPVLETPVFDDITFAWQGQGGPKIHAWE